MTEIPDDKDDLEDGYFTPEIHDFCKDFTLDELIHHAYTWPGDHHKLWWIEQIAARVGVELRCGMERGIPP